MQESQLANNKMRLSKGTMKAHKLCYLNNRRLDELNCGIRAKISHIVPQLESTFHISITDLKNTWDIRPPTETK